MVWRGPVVLDNELTSILLIFVAKYLICGPSPAIHPASRSSLPPPPKYNMGQCTPQTSLAPTSTVIGGLGHLVLGLGYRTKGAG